MAKMAIVAAVWMALQGAHPFQAAMAGTWTGTLEYRDYRSDRRVTLPTRLTIASEHAGRLQFVYTYDDGPGKVVTARDQITLDVRAGSYRIQNDKDDYDATFVANGLGEFGPDSSTVTLIGRGEENGVAVDLRITVTVTMRSLTMLRESRRAGEDWLFRNRYELTREG